MTWQEIHGPEELVNELKHYFKSTVVSIKTAEPSEASVEKTFISFKALNNEWHVNTDFFTRRRGSTPYE